MAVPILRTCLSSGHASHWADETSPPPNQDFSWNGARWHLHHQTIPIEAGWTCHKVQLDLLATSHGNAPESFLALHFPIPDWSLRHSLFVPGLLYQGNRFPCLPADYPPIVTHPDDFGPHTPPYIADIPRLATGDGPSRVQWLAGAAAQCIVAWWDPSSLHATLIRTSPFFDHSETGFSFAESADRHSASLEVLSPGVRDRHRYTMCRTSSPSFDRGRVLAPGQSFNLSVDVLTTPCPDIPTLFHLFLHARPPSAPTPHLIPFSAAWQLLEDKYNRDNWDESAGYYRVGLGENRYQDYQAGWVGGVMNSLPLLQLGQPLTRTRALRSLDFPFRAGGFGVSGFFHGIHHQGVWSGDGFDEHMWTPQARPHPARNHFHLVRKSADALHYALRQADLLRRTHPHWTMPASWESRLRGCADAFIRTWQRNHQLGQFVDVHTGVILVGGSSSAGIAPAALALAAREFHHSPYLQTAEEIASSFYEHFTRRGLSTGGPGEALQAPDSESAAGLLESYLTLWEHTGRSHWLQAATHAGAILASWQIAHNYPFPPHTEFGRLGIQSTGAVFANCQNAHGAPGLCTHSGLAYLRLHRATGEVIWLRLLRELAHGLPQYLSHPDRPIHAQDGRPLPPGWINERVNTGDWDDNLGGVFYGSTWAELSLMLTCAEIPGIYWRTDSAQLTAFDHVDATLTPAGLRISNPTPFPARVTILAEDAACAARPLDLNPMIGLPVLDLAPGATAHWSPLSP